MAELGDVIATGELSKRPARTPNDEAESRALVSLARAIADAPQSVLQRLVEVALQLCPANTAGITLLEERDGATVFRWHAAAGTHAAHLLKMPPGELAASGTSLGDGEPQLLSRPGRHFPHLESAQPRIVETLLIPFPINKQAVGTIWLISHEESRRFDAEDVRLMSDLGEFCAAALQAIQPDRSTMTETLLAHKVIGQQPGAKQAREEQGRQLRKQVEDARGEGERRFRVLVQNIIDYAIMMLDLSGRVTMWSEGAARVKGYTEHEILGQHVSIFYPPEELARGRPEQELATARAHGRSEAEGLRVRKDGGKLWVNEIITAIHDDAGNLTGYAKISRDLTERKAMEDALRDSEERNRLLIENARDYSIFMSDPDGRIVSWNTGAERIFGYSAAEVIGQDMAILFTPEDRATGEDRNELATAASEGRASDDRWQVRKGGERFWASGVTTPMRDASGTLRGFAKIARDLTDHRRLEEQRELLLGREKVARLEAERAATVRDEFLAVVSHELRTPLTAILLWSKMLEAGTVESADHPAVFSTIRQSAEAQRQLIEDLLDMSGILAGKLRLNVREVDLVPVVQAAIDAVAPMAEAKGVAVEASLGGDNGDASSGNGEGDNGSAAAGAGAGAARKLRIDPDRIQQVVWNLLSNAVKFTDAGGRVWVRVRRGNAGVRIEVQDTGRGITPDFLPFVFERFRQADASTTRAYGGLGLGLAICRQLIELHGGTIRAESAGPGHGSMFTVELPVVEVRPGVAFPSRLGPKAAAPPAFVATSVLKGVRVLLVEDDAGTRTVMKWVLERCAADVTAVESAAQAVAAFRASLSRGRYDLIASDIGLPIQDGYELIREIRSLDTRPDNGKPVPAVALTAYARAEDRAKALSAGFEAHLAKPVDPHVLVETVAQLTGRAGA
jgi:PAS domain S-box-containing protein